jgi:hypothetical protein
VYRMESAHVEEVGDGGELATSHMPHKLHRGSSAGATGTSSTSSLSISGDAALGAGAWGKSWGSCRARGGSVPKLDFFSFESGTTGLGYRDTHIGDARVDPGFTPARRTRPWSCG